jgi:hypothetical protein
MANPTRSEVRDHLLILLRSGSANGREDVRTFLLKRLEHMVEAACDKDDA